MQADSEREPVEGWSFFDQGDAMPPLPSPRFCFSLVIPHPVTPPMMAIQYRTILNLQPHDCRYCTYPNNGVFANEFQKLFANTPIQYIFLVERLLYSTTFWAVFGW